MLFDLAECSVKQTYNLLIGLVAPRPIAWITSLDAVGNLNAAPFSAFNYMGVDPPIVAIGVGNLPGPSVAGKDTAQNIRNTREFVINVVNRPLAEAMVLTATVFPPGVNELKIAGLETAPSSKVNVPRIAASPACLECREITTMEIGRSRVILGEVLAIHVNDELIDPAGPYIRAEQLQPVGRMNGLGAYVSTEGAFFTIPRTTYAQWLEKDGWRE